VRRVTIGWSDRWRTGGVAGARASARRGMAFRSCAAQGSARQDGSVGSRRPGNGMSSGGRRYGVPSGTGAGAARTASVTRPDAVRAPQGVAGCRVALGRQGRFVSRPERPTYRPGVRRHDRMEPDSGRCKLRRRGRAASNPTGGVSERIGRLQGATPGPRGSGRRQASWAPRPRTWRLLFLYISWLRRRPGERA
jgi:hypothetical protein